MNERVLGRSGLSVSPMGLGTWPLGGTTTGPDGVARRYGTVDDAEAIRAIRYAVDEGITLFDTSNNYGCGHSEKILGIALGERRRHVVLATKFGYVCAAGSREVVGSDVSPRAIRASLEQSLVRLRTDWIDLFQLHVAGLGRDQCFPVRETLETLSKEGKIRWYGWSTGDVSRARIFSEGVHCTAIQYHFNVLERNLGMLRFCEQADLGSIARGPLAMGLLAGTYRVGDTMPSADVRSGWNLRDGWEAMQLEVLARIGEVLTADGRSLPQGALGWLWATGDKVVPIPGFRTTAQVRENVDAMRWGPLTPERMAALRDLLAEVEELRTAPCTQCGECLPCSAGIDIPLVFELYNSAVIHNAFEAAGKRYRQLDARHRAGRCTACSACAPRCPQRIEIPAWMGRVHDRLLDGRGC
jgi:aryl-alcohol dehydrogenase-like predicted oxidoreductase